MTTDTDLRISTRETKGSDRRLTAAAGIGALAAFAGTAFAFPDPLGGAATAAEAAGRLASSNIELAAILLGCYMLLAAVVVAALAEALAGGPARRLIPVFGVLHLVLLMAGSAGLAAVLGVGVEIFDGVTPSALESGLVFGNAAFLLAQWTGAGMAGAVLVATLQAGRFRALGAVGAVMGAGMLVPPIGWAVLYLMPLWFAVAGVLVARRRP